MSDQLATQQPAQTLVELPQRLQLLIEFLRERIEQLPTDPIVRAQLCHEAPSGMISPLADYYDLGSVEHVAQRAWHEASVYASNYRGPAQAFLLRVYRQSSALERVGQYRWLCEGDQGDQGLTLPAQIGAAETASMLARHQEATMRLVFQHIQQRERRDSEERHELRTELQALRAERREFWQAWEDAQTTKNEREIARLQAERAESRKDKALETLQLLGPVVGAIVAKKAGLQTQVPPDSELAIVRGAFASMKPEQFAAFVQGLDPPQQIAILKWLESIAPQQQSAQAEGVH